MESFPLSKLRFTSAADFVEYPKESTDTERKPHHNKANLRKIRKRTLAVYKKTIKKRNYAAAHSRNSTVEALRYSVYYT